MTLKVDYIMISNVDATNKYVSLTSTPTDGTVALDIVGGTAQAQVLDFGVDGTKVKWDSPTYNLYNSIDASNELRVIYNQ